MRGKLAMIKLWSKLPDELWEDDRDMEGTENIMPHKENQDHLPRVSRDNLG